VNVPRRSPKTSIRLDDRIHTAACAGVLHGNTECDSRSIRVGIDKSSWRVMSAGATLPRCPTRTNFRRDIEIISTKLVLSRGLQPESAHLQSPSFDYRTLHQGQSRVARE